MNFVGEWKHINCLDMHIKVLKIQYKSLDYYKVKLEYWVGNNFMGKESGVKIYRQDLWKWKPLHGIY